MECRDNWMGKMGEEYMGKRLDSLILVEKGRVMGDSSGRVARRLSKIERYFYMREKESG